MAIETKSKEPVIHESSYIDEGAEIGQGTVIWHFSHVRGGAKIGRNCSLGQNTYVDAGVIIGDNCRIQNNVSLYAGVILEDYVFLGPSMVFTNVKTPRAKYPVQNKETGFLKTQICTGASVGANATIVCGHTVGRHALIAAGAVVTKDVAAHALMAGVPAKRVGWVCECGAILENSLKCLSCGRRYALISEKAGLEEAQP